MRALLVGFLGLALLLSGIAFVVALPGAAAASRTYTLYGRVLGGSSGWGFSPTSISEPGPTLYVEVGDTVTLHLFAADNIAHNWTIDFNNNTQVDAGEIFSPNFSSDTTAVDFIFTVPSGRVGTFTYRCGLHPTAMTGLIVILGPPTFTLYGSVGTPSGWGNTSTSITNPGPILVVNQGDTVSIDLYAADDVAHTFYVDWNNNGRFDASTEVQSEVFSSSTVPLRFNFTASQAGTFTYYCGIHGSLMRGTLVVKATGTGGTAPPAGGIDLTLLAIVIIIVVIVAAVALLAIRRKPKSPPAQPPQ